MITFFHVHKAYPGGRVALDDVCLTIERGEFAVFSGPSGAGKSSLLRAIMFELRPDRGEVVVETFRSSKAKGRQIPRLRRQLGVVFQDFKLLRDRSVFENVAFALRITGVDDPRQIKERTLGVLHRVGIYERRNALPRELSGGEQQRVGVARALVNDPLYLLADEPTGDLDPRAGDEIFALLREIGRRGTAVLVATHDPRRADAARDRLFQVERGAVREHPRPVRQVERIERIEPADEP